MHTSLPWHIEIPGVVTDIEYGLICDCGARDNVGVKGRLIAQENARFIVRACNNHDRLLAALEATIPALVRLGDFVGNVDEGGASGQGKIDRCALLLQVRESIAMADIADEATP